MREQLTFSEKLKKKVVEQSIKDAEERRGQNRYYKQFFENWLEYEVTDPKGKKRIMRVYDGAWYTHRLSAVRRRLLKLCYLMMWAAALLLFVFAALQRTGGNYAKYVLFTEGLGLIGLVVNAYPLLIYIITPPKMTLGEFRTSSHTLQWTGRLCALCLMSAACTMLLHALLELFRGGADTFTELLCALAFFASSALVHCMELVERKVIKYDITPGRATAPENGEKIRDRDLTY